MKKTLALLLSLAMLFTALSVNVFAAGTTAKVTVVADTTTSDTNNVGFAVKLSGFSSLKGVDLTITGTGLTFNDSVTARGLDTNLQKDVNYKVSGNQIHIVELTDWKNNDVVIKATANLENGATAPKINVEACKLAKDGTTLYKVDTDYTFDSEIPVASVIKQEIVTVGNDKTQITQSDAGDGYFIPYGGVSNEGESVEKDGNGNFTTGITATTEVVKFPKPANGITTFGVSESTVEDKPARQFGAYAENYDAAKKYGSMVLVGDWNDFVSAYKAKYTDAYISEIVAKLYDVYDTYIPGNKYVVVSVRDISEIKHSVKIYKVAQQNYMWKSANVLEYAARVYGLKANETYTSVSYAANSDGSNPVFSAAVKSETYTAK